MKTARPTVSWIDRLIIWIDALPIPVWLFYSLVLLLITLINVSVFGPAEVASTFELFYGAFYALYFLALNHALQRIAVSTFDQFVPSLDFPKGDLEKSRRRFTITPSWVGWLALGFGIVSAAYDLATLREGALVFPDASLVVSAYEISYLVFIPAMLAQFVTNTIRRLRQISRLHNRVKRIDLFSLDPLRAFSRFSSGTAIGLVLAVLINQPEFVSAANALLDIAFYILLSLLALVVFLVPLVGLRNRIADERDKKIENIMADVEAVGDKISRAIRRDQLNKLDKLKDGLDGLIIQRDELLKVQTWPWKTATIRGFSSAFLLPIILWLITRLLERII